MSRLPDTDLANAAALPIAERHASLRRVKVKGVVTINYWPTKRRQPDIFNVRGSLLGDARAVDLEKILRDIGRECKNPKMEQANREVVTCLHAWAVANSVFARRYFIRPFQLSGTRGNQLSFCSPFVLIKGDRPHILFIDPRRQNGLSPEGRHFVFSMMHWQAREPLPDLRDAELLIAQFPMADAEHRFLSLHAAGDLAQPLYDYDDVEQRVRETLDIWHVVELQRAEELRRRADGTRADFGLS
jgi:hypothetical protein